MTIKFDIPADRISALLSALGSAADNATANRHDAERNDDDELVAAWTSDENILEWMHAEVERQTK